MKIRRKQETSPIFFIGVYPCSISREKRGFQKFNLIRVPPAARFIRSAVSELFAFHCQFRCDRCSPPVRVARPELIEWPVLSLVEGPALSLSKGPLSLA